MVKGRAAGPGLTAQQAFLHHGRHEMARSAEDLLFYCLRHLNTRHAFLQRIQSDGGDVSLLLTIERDSASDFTLPVAMARSLVKLGISLEFKFES